jgi:hypothetical protein
MTKESLYDAARQQNEVYIPLTIEHDPRIPPVGRGESSEVVELEDGEWALVGTYAIFEEGDSSKPVTSGRRIVSERQNPDKFAVVYDISYENPDGHKFIGELATLSGEKPQIGVKRSAEPISILTIVIGVIIGNILAGFLQKIGADCVDPLKKVLGDFFHKHLGKERLIHWKITTEINDEPVEIGIILTNPDSVSIQEFIDSGLGNVDYELSRYNVNKDIARIVFEYKSGKLIQKYALRADGIPVTLNLK